MSTLTPKKKKSQKSKVLREIAKKEPKIYENEKKLLILKGSKSSETISQILKDFHHLKQPNCINYTKKNDVLPFEDVSSLEFFSQTTDASLFAFGNHSKKRPNNLILGRMFDHHLLDMMEVGIENYKGLKDFKVEKSAIGNKPSFIFIGEEFEQKEDFKKLSNLILDIFSGYRTSSINLVGLEHVIICTSTPEKVYFRTYRIKLKKSGTKLPRVELEEMGPSFDIKIRRTQFASNDLMKEALKVPKETKPKKIKNNKRNDLFTTGNIHMERQDLSNMIGKQSKALRNQKRKSTEGEDQKSKKSKL